MATQVALRSNRVLSPTSRRYKMASVETAILQETRPHLLLSKQQIFMVCCPITHSFPNSDAGSLEIPTPCQDMSSENLEQGRCEWCMFGHYWLSFRFQRLRLRLLGCTTSRDLENIFRANLFQWWDENTGQLTTTLLKHGVTQRSVSDFDWR